VLITAVGSPPEGQTIADTTQQTLNKVKDVDFDSLAANASTAATQATASVAAGNTLTGVIGDSSKQGTVAFNAQATWDKLRGVELTKFATQEDIAELRCLVLYLWWLDHGCRYLSTGVTDHPTGLVYEQIRIRDAPQDVTPDAFKSAAGAHQLEERLWPCDIDRLLQIVKAYHAHVSPSTPTARRQKT